MRRRESIKTIDEDNPQIQNNLAVPPRLLGIATIHQHALHAVDSRLALFLLFRLGMLGGCAMDNRSFNPWRRPAIVEFQEVVQAASRRPLANFQVVP